MSILTQLEQDIKEAMKARQEARLGAVRLIKSTVKNKEIELIRPLSEAEFFDVLSSMGKQRRDSIEQFEKANRMDAEYFQIKYKKLVKKRDCRNIGLLSETEIYFFFGFHFCCINLYSFNPWTFNEG